MDAAEAAIIRSAADVLVDPLLATDIGPRLRCVEAEALALMIELMLGRNYAQLFLLAHAWGDDDPEDAHHALYLKNRVVH
jgi:hypothetical protein